MKYKLAILFLLSAALATAEETINDDLRINGDLTIVNGEEATIRSSLHNLSFRGTGYAHKGYHFYPDESTTGNTWSHLSLFTADTSLNFDEKIRLHTNGISYLNGGKIGIGTKNPEAALHIVTNSAGSSDNSIRIYAPNIGPYNSHIHYGTTGDWYIRSAKSGGRVILQDTPGNVGIGTTSPDHKLDVNGTVRAKEVIVETGWSDFVFEDSYRLRPLHEIETHIEEHGHLPDVPPASVVESQGLSVGETQKIMMQKIEELTLYMIQQEKKNQVQQREIEELRKQLDQQTARYNSE